MDITLEMLENKFTYKTMYFWKLQPIQINVKSKVSKKQIEMSLLSALVRVDEQRPRGDTRGIGRTIFSRLGLHSPGRAREEVTL